MHSRPIIGLAGCGRWGRHILRDLHALGCLVDVADPDPQARDQARSGGARNVVRHIDDFKHDHQGYVIAAWTTTHASLINNLVKRQKPVFCEKPLTSSPKDLDQILNQSLAPVFVMHKWRFHPAVEAMACMAQSCEYGAVRQLVTRRLQWTTPHGDVDAIWSLAPHDLSMIYGILGFMPQPSSAVALADESGSARSLFGVLGGVNEPGAIVHVAANWVSVERSVTMILENAIVVLDDPLADHIKLYPGQGGQAIANVPDRVIKISVSQEYPLIRELRVFIDYLAGGPPPITDAVEGALIVRTLSSLRRLAGLED